MAPPHTKYKTLYWMYSFVVVTTLMIGYPLHLILGLISSSSLKELMQSLSITLTSTVCSIKTIAIWWRLDKVADMFTIIRRQDERLRSAEEVEYMKTIVYPQVRFVIRLFYVICAFLSLFGELSLIVSGLLGNWRIQYKAYFPFDPNANTKNYVYAHMYQLIGVNYTLLQNLVNDTFASSHLALLRGQVKMLARRVAKIGHDPRKSQRENNQQLLECIRDHKDLLEYRQILEQIISVYMFFQILLCGLNMCVILVYMVIFVRNDIITLSYYSTHLIGVMCEILPSCYYGTLLEDAFQDIAQSHHSMKTDSGLNTRYRFRTHFICWRVLGMMPPKKYRPLYWLYSLLINLLVTIGYPLHLILGLFTSTSIYQIIENVGITLTCTVCSMKTFAIWWRFNDIDRMFDIIKRQDEHTSAGEQTEYMKRKVYPPIRALIYLFYVLCSVIPLAAEIAIIVSGIGGTWLHIYLGYFPFDTFASTMSYTIANIYQFFGLVFTVTQNLVNDTFAGTHLMLLSGQVHLLGMRVSNIGYDPQKSQAENNQELLDCIRDHLDLLEYRRKVEDIISLYMLFQLVFASVNMCVTLVFMLLFVKDVITMTYYGFYFVGMIFEVLPSCYFGTILEDEFQDLAYSLFKCNWPDQDARFKKNLRIFVEQASHRIYVTAYLFRINNISFLSVVKGSYSIFR
ncbi:odorant receptor 59a-like [Musca vetustissima]|uniref:odorant receptor 59a-like n=1 Tax=Musca vetustissima TaxID=27455 RepID=UPI002AB71041|nr:odorant receptor 59a-like [Musca vetustissima]